MKKERIVKHKFFIIDIEKEQKFLDSYREKGYKLESVNNNTFRYVFRKCKEDFIPKVRIDYREFKKSDEYQEYLTMFEDAGWKHIRGSRYSGAQYFEQMNPETSDVLFSDSQSYAGLYKRLYNYAITWTLFSVIFFSISKPVEHIKDFVHPKELFFTPGLWEAKGLRFVAGFLLELPFVFLRNGIFVFWIIMIAVFLSCAIKAKKKEKELSAKVSEQ